MRLPSHRMGVHYIGDAHHRTSDFDYMGALRPAVIKIVNPDPDQIRRALNAIDSGGYVWLRDHPLSEQKNDAMQRPAETGRRHADEWNDHLKTRYKDVFDPGRIIVSGINEPYVRNEAEENAALQYNLALLNRATELGFRVAALNLSVGWPRNLGQDQPPYWKPFLPLEAAINAGGHFLSTHEYWYADPDESWSKVVPPDSPNFGWLAYRINYCPLQVPIIIGECGMEKFVDLQRWENEGKPAKGWISNISPSAYAEQLWRYADKLQPNVVAVLPFTTDWGSHDFQSMDTDPAHGQIVSRKHNQSWPAAFPIEPIHHDREFGEDTQPPVDPPAGTISPPYLFSRGHFVRGFGSTPTHGGTDIGMAEGTPLLAMADGVVAWSDFDAGGYGNYVRIFYPALGFDSFYGHMSRRDVKNGDTVTPGQVVGLSGNTGNSTGPHLHLEFRLKNMDAANPLHAYDGHSYFGRGRTDPQAILWMLGFRKPW